MQGNFHEHLKKIRKSRHYTQAQMADILGIPRSTYSNYEAGNRCPDFDTLLRISDTLQCSLDELFGRGDVMYGRIDAVHESILKEPSAPYHVDTSRSHYSRKRRKKGKGLGIGVQDFRKLRERGSYYVDKTEMIADFLDSDTDVTLITRPRRFGKTLNMSMISEFLDCTKKSEELFEGTWIGESEYMEDCNRYPVVFLSFLNAKGDTEEELLRRICDVIRQEYKRYRFIFEAQTVEEDTRITLAHIYSRLCTDADSPETMKSITTDAILRLCHALKEYYGQNIYLLIDEYDTPFISANVGGYYESVRTFLSMMFSSSLKGNSALEKAMLTGIQRVAKENIFSGLNHIRVYTVKDREYAKYFGFTEAESAKLLKDYGLELTDEVRQMYDGYRFGNAEVYNPWSMICYVSDKKLESFWVNTSENSIIEHAMDQCGEEFRKDYQRLLEDGKVSVQIELENSFFEQPGEAALWGLLVNAGMVTVEKEIREGYYSIRIPNKEVANAFQKLTAHYLQVKYDLMGNMMFCLERGALEDFGRIYQRILLELPSYHDLKDENSYHMMMLGMCAYMYGEYEVMSNRESGHGRSDIILKPLQKNLPGIIMEFKYTKDESQDLQELADEALKQVKQKAYAAGLTGTVYYLGLAHHGKYAEVKWEV